MAIQDVVQPSGIRLAARYGREDVLFRLAAASEDAPLRRDRRSRIHVANLYHAPFIGSGKSAIMVV